MFFSPQNLKIYTPIDRPNRAELKYKKYIIFDLTLEFSADV